MSTIQQKLEQALRAETPADCLTCIHDAIAILEQAEPDLSAGAEAKELPPLNCEDLLLRQQEMQAEIDRLTAKLMAEKACYEGQKKLATELAKEIDRLTAQNKAQVERIAQLESERDACRAVIRELEKSGRRRD